MKVSPRSDHWSHYKFPSRLEIEFSLLMFSSVCARFDYKQHAKYFGKICTAAVNTLGYHVSTVELRAF